MSNTQIGRAENWRWLVVGGGKSAREWEARGGGPLLMRMSGRGGARNVLRYKQAMIFGVPP